MSVLIKGMEVPKACWDCEFTIWDSNAGESRCFFTGDYTSASYDLTHGLCPLVPVPPHGRLIDVDIVAQDLQEMSEDIERSFPYLNKNDALMIERGIVLARQYVLNSAPIIIEAEDGE